MRRAPSENFEHFEHLETGGGGAGYETTHRPPMYRPVYSPPFNPHSHGEPPYNPPPLEIPKNETCNCIRYPCNCNGVTLPAPPTQPTIHPPPASPGQPQTPTTPGTATAQPPAEQDNTLIYVAIGGLALLVLMSK